MGTRPACGEATHTDLRLIEISYIMSSETLRLRDTLEGHGNWVTALATCDNVPDMIVSASRDKTLIVWQLTNSNDSTETFAVPKRSLHGHSHIVQDVALSHDGDYALSASWDKTLRLWNLNDGTSVRFVGHQGDVMSCAFTPDNLMVVSAGRDKTIRVWNVIGDEMYNIDGAQSHTDWVTGVRVAPSNEPKIVSAGCDKVVKVSFHFREVMWNIFATSELYAMRVTNSPRSLISRTLLLT